MSNGQYGVIHEVGDLGLNFNPVSDKEQREIENSKKEKENKTK